jgi:hypothetical protein
LKDVFGEEPTRYELLRKGKLSPVHLFGKRLIRGLISGALLGILIPLKKLAPRKRAAVCVDAHTKAERKKVNKNQSGKEETERMRNAMKTIEKHLGMTKANRREILARLVEEGELSEPCAWFSKS